MRVVSVERLLRADVLQNVEKKKPEPEDQRKKERPNFFVRRGKENGGLQSGLGHDRTIKAGTMDDGWWVRGDDESKPKTAGVLVLFVSSSRTE